MNLVLSLDRYLVKLDETQSVFTGKQQRDGVSVIPHLVAGVWRSRGALHATDNIEQSVSRGGVHSPTLPVGDGIEDALPDLATRVAALHLDEPQEGEGDHESDGVGGSPFDWQAYRTVWQQTPVDQAITAMFAEFAVLHAEMSGYTCSTSPLPLTLDVGKCIVNRAERFVTLYVTPILGAQHSTKIHRLLCHVMGAIRMHGNINNGNAGMNEGLHREDKRVPARVSWNLRASLSCRPRAHVSSRDETPAMTKAQQLFWNIAEVMKIVTATEAASMLMRKASLEMAAWIGRMAASLSEKLIRHLRQHRLDCGRSMRLCGPPPTT